MDNFCVCPVDNSINRPTGRLIFGRPEIKEGRLVHFTGTDPKINYLYLLKKLNSQTQSRRLSRRIRRGLAGIISPAFGDDQHNIF